MEDEWYDLGDGFPVVPVTKARLLATLAHTHRQPQEILGKCPPSYKPVTVEKAAANAVLAGCRPEFINVVLAALTAVLSEPFNLHGLHATTMGGTPCLVINGSAAEKLGLNHGCGALGSGSRANATIGRAVKLVLQNVGGAKLGGTESTTLGTPMKFSLCVAEDEALVRRVGWNTLAETKGAQGGSAVTAIGVTSGPHQVVDFKTRGAEWLVDMIAASMVTSYTVYLPMVNEVVLFISPEHLETLKEGGVHSKEDLANRLWKRCNRLIVPTYYRLARSHIPGVLGMVVAVLAQTLGYLSVLLGMNGLPFLPKFTSPESFHIVVTGGKAGKFSSFCPGFGVGRKGMPTYKLSQSVTHAIDPLLSEEEVKQRMSELESARLDVNPVSASALNSNSFSPAERAQGELKGTIGLVDISKPMGNFFLDRVQTRLEKRFPLLEGLPTVAVASDAFIPQAKFQAEKLGMEDMVVVFVRHPISNCTKAEIEEKADEVFQQLVDGLTAGSFKKDERWQVTEAEEVCKT